MDLGPQAAGTEPCVHQPLNDPGQLGQPVLKRDGVASRTNDGEKTLDRLEFVFVHYHEYITSDAIRRARSHGKISPLEIWPSIRVAPLG
jgi:hypothetical protein